MIEFKYGDIVEIRINEEKKEEAIKIVEKFIEFISGKARLKFKWEVVENNIVRMKCGRSILKIPIDTLEEAFNELPEKADTKTVCDVLSKVSGKKFGMFRSYVLRVMADLFKDKCYIKKDGNKLYLVKNWFR